MFNKKEFTPIAIILVILTISISFLKSWNAILYSFITIFFVLAINILAKKISSYYLDSEIKINLWTIKRYGFKPNYHFRNEFQSGAIFPLLFSVLSFGTMTWLACLVFDVKAKTYMAAKRYGLYSFSEMTEYHLALIATAGIITNLIFAIIGYFLGFPTFAKLNIYYAFFNMLPISNLDGNKIFFGSIILWSFLAAITLVALGYAIFLV